jgi:hypothetical protein
MVQPLRMIGLRRIVTMRLVTAFALLFTLAAAGCGGSPTSPSSSSGTLRVMLTDSPFTDAKSLLVTFSEVSVHRSDQPDDSGWTKLTFNNSASSRTCDLKKLQAAQDVLGTGSPAAGHYTQIRLTVSSAKLFFDNAASGNACDATIAAPSGRSTDVTIPSGEVKLNREFDVSSSGATTITLDFDGDRSIRETGNGQFMMSPVITVVSVQ